MRVIPAVDLLDGKVVRLRQGSFDDVTVYNDNPVDQARQFSEAGFKHIHVVDLNGAKEGKFVNLPSIEDILEHTDISVQAGGGIRTFDDIDKLLKKGISKVVCSSMAVKNKPEWIKALQQYGHRCILGMDLKDGEIAYSGWQKTDKSSINDFLSGMISAGLKEVLCTDISRDGTLEGVNTDLHLSLMNKYPNLDFIASGGVADETDLARLDEQDTHAVVVGRAYYEGALTLEQMSRYNAG